MFYTKNKWQDRKLNDFEHNQTKRSKSAKNLVENDVIINFNVLKVYCN